MKTYELLKRQRLVVNKVSHKHVDNYHNKQWFLDRLRAAKDREVASTLLVQAALEGHKLTSEFYEAAKNNKLAIYRVWIDDVLPHLTDEQIQKLIDRGEKWQQETFKDSLPSTARSLAIIKDAIRTERQGAEEFKKDYGELPDEEMDVGALFDNLVRLAHYAKEKPANEKAIRETLAKNMDKEWVEPYLAFILKWAHEVRDEDV